MPATRTRPSRHLTALAGPATSVSTDARLDTATLSDIVHGLAVAEDLWRPFVLHDADERARVRLLATPAYEVWLLGWTPGQSVGLHDHGGANAAFIVVDGTLTETAAPESRCPHAGRTADSCRHCRHRRVRAPPRHRQPLEHARHEHPRLLETASFHGLLRRPGTRNPRASGADTVGRGRDRRHA